MGVTTKKNIIPITNGDTIFPNKIPNLNQSLFNGVSIFEFSKPKARKINEIINDQILILSLFIKGYKLTIKNTMKKTKPKFLFEGSFISLFCLILVN